MKSILVFSFFIFSFSSKGQTFSVYNCLKKETFEYVEKAKLEPIKNDLLVKYLDTGRHIVFRMIKFYDCPNIWDEEIAIKIYWMVPKDSTSFIISVTEADSLDMPLYYCTIGPGPMRGNSQLFRTANGFIKGFKQGNHWLIECNIEIKFFNRYSKTIESRSVRESDLYQKWNPGKGKKKVSLYQF